jgi:allantoinase
MPAQKKYDLLVKNVRIVRPNKSSVQKGDVAIAGGKFARVAREIPAEEARKVVDGKGRLAFPGLVDPHMHTGIYSPLAEDAITESRAAAQGGVTSSLNYFRTGQYYLNKGGPYASFFPEVLAISDGKFHVDYAYHLAPMDRQHIDEIPLLVEKHGVTSFKIYMFYGGYGLHGASSGQHKFLMIDEHEKYDVAHFEFVMRGVQRAMQLHPDRRDAISLSLHCETAEIMAAYTRLVQQEGKLTGLRAYSAARPPHSEGLAICIASYLAHETECPNINLLHLTSRKAVEAALKMAKAFPHVNFRREVTVGHLLLDYDAPTGVLAKVNPPIRSRADVEFLWETLLDGKLDWVCSDHACCRHEMKVDAQDPGLPRQVGLRRHRVPAVRPRQRRSQARAVVEPHRRTHQLERRAPLRPAEQGRRRGRLRCRPRAVRPRQVLRRARRGIGVLAGLHALRRHGVDRPGRQHLPARQADLRQGQGRG